MSRRHSALCIIFLLHSDWLKRSIKSKRHSPNNLIWYLRNSSNTQITSIKVVAKKKIQDHFFQPNHEYNQ